MCVSLMIAEDGENTQMREYIVTISGLDIKHTIQENMIAINGFDEGYGETSLSDATDLDWRFRSFGLQIKSCKNVANQSHLWYAYNERDTGSFYWNKIIDNRKNKRFICQNGISMHKTNFQNLEQNQ